MIKVAAYCRVSTDKQEQYSSFMSQQLYYREYVSRNPDWELFDIYADEGISGTNTIKRMEFNRMMRDAHQKKFNIIITKEVSRFSRNILDTIAYTRELKALGIGVIFMNDGLNTMSPDAELRLSIMGSIAQEESRKTSERVKWGQTRQMERGIVFGRSMLGYDVVAGKLTVNPEGAEIVTRIFYQYGIEKKGTTVIARQLREDGIKTLAGNSFWSASQILKILKNEKYVGDLVQKKTITPDYLTHIKKYNHGEEPFVILPDHHEPIIERELWFLVQNEISLRRRRKTSKVKSGAHLFSGKIICAECGAAFVMRTRKRRDGSVYKYWSCLTAVREGRERSYADGTVRGCSVGKQIRNDLAVDMVKRVFSDLNLDCKKLVSQITQLALRALYYAKLSYLSYEMLERQNKMIQKKKREAIDAYLSGVLTKDELQQLKSDYEKQLQSIQQSLKEHERFAEEKESVSVKIQEAVTEILKGDLFSSGFVKTLLEYIQVSKDGIVKIKLNHLDCLWHFKLVKDNNITEQMQK